MNLYPALRPLLFAMQAERAHRLSLRLLDSAAALRLSRLTACRMAPLPTRVCGLALPNPVGLAAGLDKNGAHIDALAALGFGFIEVGTVTPRPQAGNPPPRLFRLPEQQALINRLGFNNHGVDALIANLERTRWSGVLGINIGKNKDTPNERAADDYLHCLERVYARASYLTINISSPNTQGLRQLQQGQALKSLIGVLREAQERLGARHGRRPMLLKIAPDLNPAQMDAIAQVAASSGVDGLICTNTTLSRDALGAHPLAREAGGLSGRPLLQAANRILQGMRTRLGETVPLIGVGGITCGADALAKRQAGAALVQLYSGLIYRGPALIRDCVEALRQAPAAAMARA